MIVRLKEEYAAKLADKLASALGRLEHCKEQLKSDLGGLKLEAESLANDRVRVQLDNLLAESSRWFQETSYLLAEFYPPGQQDIILSCHDVVVVG